MSDIIMPAAWHRQALNVSKAFERKFGRAPNADEAYKLRGLHNAVVKAMTDNSPSGEAANELAFRVAEEWFGTGVYPDLSRRRQLQRAASERVQQYVNDYESHHRSFFSNVTGSVGTFISNAAKTAGRPLHAALHAVASATGTVANLAGKVPFVGPALHATLDLATGPFALADNIAAGRRVDKALLDHLERQVSDVKEVAPYAQTIVSVVPGVGQGVSGIIGASLSMAQGHNITDAMAEGVLDAIPGGPVAKSLGAIAHGVMKGDRIDTIALAAVPLPEEQKKLIGGAISVINDVANKRPVSPEMVAGLLQNIPGGGQAVIDFAKANNIPNPVAAAEAALKTLPGPLKDAVKIGASLGHAKTLQGIAGNAAEAAVPKLEAIGLAHVKLNPDLQQLAKTLPNPNSFFIGTGLMQQAKVSPAVIERVRKGLTSPQQRKSFDMALAAHIGKVTAPKREGSPAQLAGYYATRGMVGTAPAQRKALLKTVKSHPDMKKGAAVAVSELVEPSTWHKVLRYFGFKATV